MLRQCLHLAEDSNADYPPSLLPSLREVAFVCPLCHEKLTVPREREVYHCVNCTKDYPLHGGIPDFRIFPDPFLSFQEDHDRTEIVLAALERYPLERLLEHYWSFSDITPVALRPKFIRSALLGEQRAQRTLRAFDDGTFKKPVKARRVLEIGSGTGNFLAVAMSHYEQVIGTDIAMRWLHVSRRRFMDKGLPVPPLVCCCAEYLPFPDNSFDLIVTASTLEFVRDQERMLGECARTLTVDGALYVNTVNRYSIAKDPYAYLWGVGFLPRAWQARYVLWRRCARYESIKPLSLSELNKIAKKYFASREFALPDVDSEALREFSTSTRLQARIYSSLRKALVFKSLLRRVGPSWDALFRKH